MLTGEEKGIASRDFTNSCELGEIYALNVFSCANNNESRFQSC